MKTKLQMPAIMLLILFVKLSCPVFAQKIIFNKISPPEGKSNFSINSIAQDINGFMWFASGNVLYCYDGYKMISYKYNPIKTDSLGIEIIESVFADHDGAIWIGGLGKGLDKFDPVTGIFTHHRHDLRNALSLSNDTVTVILRDKLGLLWIGTHGGLDQFNTETNKFIHYRYKANDPKSISNNVVRAIYEDKRGTLWIGTGSPFPSDGGNLESGGLNRLDRNTGTFTRYMHDPNDIHSLSNNKVRAIFEDNKGVFWIGTARLGLHKMNRENGTFERIEYNPYNKQGLSPPRKIKNNEAFDHITFITQDVTGSYWLGTVESGLCYFNPATGENINFKGKGNAPNQIDDDGVWRAFTSREGILWICTNTGNLLRIDPLLTQFRHRTISTDQVNYFYEEPNGNLWIGTEKELFRNNKTKGIVKRDIIDIIPSVANDNRISILKADRLGNVWIGTGGGLAKWDKASDSFVHYKNDPKNDKKPFNNWVYFIYEENDLNVWLGKSSGLSLFNPKTGSNEHFLINPKDTNSFGQNFVTSIHQDNTGRLWIGSWSGGGLYLFNRENKSLKKYIHGKNISCIYEDYKGILWVGCSNRLYNYEPGSDSFIPFADSIPFSGITEIRGIVEDNQHNLWISTTNAILRLNHQRNGISVFGKNYGVGENFLVWNSCYKGLHGELYFGDATGYFTFDPEEISRNLVPPQIILTRFNLADQIVKPGNDGPLKEKLSNVKEINLRYNQNVFSFEFASIDYSNLEENQHFYLLENYENDWHKSNLERKAYYFNIPPGKYIFRVKGVNGRGVWAEKSIEINIVPPWWRTVSRTWWAYSIYGLLFIGAVIGIDRFQRRRLLKAEKERNRQREFEQAKEIEKAYTKLKATQAQLIQSEKMASLGELTAGIAHEIQNPLNFINNFSEVSNELIVEMKEEFKKGDIEEGFAIADDIKQNLEKILTHGKRADGIVKGMLQHSRYSSGVKEPTDINKLADEYLRLAYHGLRAKDKSFNTNLKTDFDESIGTINVVPQDIGRAVLNLITNAFYAVAEKKKLQLNGYDPTVLVSTKKVGDKLLISVKDNGNGIPAKVLDKIFQPFFTTKPTGQGTGLGLSLSYDIVKAHEGELKVDSKEGEGTEFTINLPV